MKIDEREPSTIQEQKNRRNDKLKRNWHFPLFFLFSMETDVGFLKNFWVPIILDQIEPSYIPPNLNRILQYSLFFKNAGFFIPYQTRIERVLGVYRYPIHVRYGYGIKFEVSVLHSQSPFASISANHLNPLNNQASPYISIYNFSLCI